MDTAVIPLFWVPPQLLLWTSLSSLARCDIGTGWTWMIWAGSAIELKQFDFQDRLSPLILFRPSLFSCWNSRPVLLTLHKLISTTTSNIKSSRHDYYGANQYQSTNRSISQLIKTNQSIKITCYAQSTKLIGFGEFVEQGGSAGWRRKARKNVWRISCESVAMICCYYEDLMKGVSEATKISNSLTDISNNSLCI